MYLYIYIYTEVYIHIYICIYLGSYIYIHIHTQVRARIHLLQQSVYLSNFSHVPQNHPAISLKTLVAYLKIAQHFP